MIGRSVDGGSAVSPNHIYQKKLSVLRDAKPQQVPETKQSLLHDCVRVCCKTREQSRHLSDGSRSAQDAHFERSRLERRLTFDVLGHLDMLLGSREGQEEREVVEEL